MLLKIGTILTIVLILFNFTLTITKADDDEESKLFDVVRKNWLDQNQTFWPTYDMHDDLFYIFHHENVEQMLSLKKDIINWSGVNPNGTILSFRYWANNDLGRLRSKPDTAKAKDLLLNQANQWTDAKIGEITQTEWNNLTLISGGDEFTLALKDVLFSYTDSNHKQVTINCSELNGCSNIFDRPLAQSQQCGSSHFVPYQRNNPQAQLNQPPQNYLQVNRPHTKNANDFCISFFYKASGPLFVTADISIAQPLTIEFLPTTEQAYKSVCASALTPSLDESLRALYFWFANDKPIDLLDDNYVYLSSNTQPEVNNTLSEGIFLHDQKEQPFFDGYYASYDSSISFTPFHDLQNEKKQLKSQLTQKVDYRSKWIKMPTKRSSNNFEITFNFNETYEIPDFVQFTMIILAPDRPKLFEKRLEASSLNIFNIKFDSSAHLPPIQYVQILFRFEVDYSKVKDEKEFAFKLEQFSANDPCVDEHGMFNECNHRGYCVRNYEQFEGICHCEAGYSAKDQCKSIDYCTIKILILDVNSTHSHWALGLENCKNQGLNCVSNAEKESFECDCGNNNLRWNSATLSCFPKEVAKCPDNQIHQLIDGKLQCVCRYGMRLDTQTNKCVPNSCSEENNQKCIQKGAICQVHSSGTKCACEPDKVAFLTNTDRPDEWTCMDKCLVVEHFLDGQKDQRLEALRCQQFSKCDSLQVEFDNYYGIEKKIAFKNSNLTLHYGPDAAGVCKCDIGFQKSSRYQCEPSSAPIWLLSGLQFEIFLNLTKQIEKQETVEQMVSNLFETIFTEKFQTRESIYPNLFSKCEHKSSFGVSCDVFLSTLKSAQEITEKLLHNCSPITGSTGKQCVLFTSHILRLKSHSIYRELIFTGEIILQADSVTPPKLFSNFCDNKELCPTNFDNSICKSTTSNGINGTNFFDCLCDGELFDVSATTLLSSNSLKLKGEKCKPKNLCQTKPAQFGCKDPTAQCHSVVEYENGTYVPISFCTCPKTSHVPHDREYICPK